MSSFNSAYGAGLSPRPHLVRMVREGKKDHASFHRASMQTGINTSPGLFASASARPRGEDMASLSFPVVPSSRNSQSMCWLSLSPSLSLRLAASGLGLLCSPFCF